MEIDVEKALAEKFLHLANSLSKDKLRELSVMMLLASVGEDVTREGLKDTPKRVSKMYDEIFGGYTQSPQDILKTVFEDDDFIETANGIVLVKDIPFYSHCEHHMVPFFGVAHVAYIPDKKVVGISKMARLVDCFAKRLQIQERLTDCVASKLMSYLAPKGVAVVIEAEHLCMTMRGVKKPGTKTITAAMRGVFMDDAATRAEFYQLIK